MTSPRDVLKAAACLSLPVPRVPDRVGDGAAPITFLRERERDRHDLATTDDGENRRSSAARSSGAVPHGTRSIVPVTGGDFEGPRLRGKVLPGGGDWLLLRADGVLELDLRITLETDDHALIYMRFQGLRHGPPDVIAALGRGEVVDPARYYFRTLPRFETSADKYAFLNRIITVGVGEARPDGAVHRIDEIL